MAEDGVARNGPVYHIRISGALDAKWAAWFEGLVMTSRAHGETLLSGTVVDQAALHGVLGRIHGLGLPLLLLVRTVCPCPEMDCARHGHCAACAAWRSAHSDLPYCFRAGNEWDKRCGQLYVLAR